MAIPRIVVVGGGAGGLELVTRLGRKLGKSNKAEIILVDRHPYLETAAARSSRRGDGLKP